MNYFEELKKHNYLIAIPSRDREFFLKNGTGVWRSFNRPPQEYPLILVIREKEKKNYDPYYKGEYLLTRNNNIDITITRQMILDYAIEKGYEYLIMMDDDIILYYRDENLSSKYTSKLEELYTNNVLDNIIYDSIKLTNKDFPLTGIPMKQGSFSCKYMFEKNRVIIRYVCYHIPTWAKEGVRCDDLLDGNIGVMEDYFVQLTWIKKGYKTLSNCKWAVGDYATGYKGGCNATRTLDVQNSSAKMIKKLFPDLAILKVKTDGKQNWKEDRLDVSLRLKVPLKEKGELSYIPKKEVEEKYGIKV